MPVTILHTSDGTLDPGDKDELAELEKRIASGKPKILLHLHGGLVNEKSGVAAARRLSGKGKNAFNAADDWEQVYVIWRTGALETLRTNWRDIFTNDRLYRTLLKRLISLISGKIGALGDEGRSVGDVAGLTPAEVERRLLSADDHPFADIDALVATEPGSSRAAVEQMDDRDFEAELSIQLATDRALITVAEDIEAALTKDEPGVARSFESGDALQGEQTLKYVDDQAIARWRPEVQADGRSLLGGVVLKSLIKHGVAIGKRIIKRYRAGKDHGLHATVVEELVRELYGDLVASIVWGMMKDDASDHFKPGALGDALLRILSKNADRRLLISAHSAGSIWASEMLLAADRKGIALPVDLMFMAPAVRTSKFAAALKAKSGDIGHFRMFAMGDALERADVLLGPGLGFLYPSSLLYFVSGLCEEADKAALADAPLLGMQRFLGPDSPWLEDRKEGQALSEIQAFLGQGNHRAIFSKSTAGAGMNTDSTSHGAFDDNPATLASIANFF